MKIKIPYHMKRKNHRHLTRLINLKALFLLCGTAVMAATVSAQPKAFLEAGTAQPAPLPVPPKAVAPAAAGTGTNIVTAPEPNPFDKFFNHQVPEAIARGKFNLNVRLRYEQVDEDG